MKTFVVVCPGNSRTGGPEALHQLSHQINQVKGAESCIFYTGPHVKEIISEYQSLYPSPTIEHPDIDGAHVIIPESFDPKAIAAPKRGRKWVWWLSAQRHYPLAEYRGMGHLFQSEYAREKMALLGIDGLMLTDYLRDIFFTEQAAAERKPWVAFNASKSAVAAIRLINSGQKLTFAPIVKMRPNMVRAVLGQCSLYIDFGWHPGRDRIPREAVMSGCMVFTSRDGAANNDVDIPIAAEYKCNLTELDESAKQLSRIVNEYSERQYHFEQYRDVVYAQKATFRAEVQSFVDRADAVSENQACNISDELDQFLLRQERCQRVWRSDANKLAMQVFLDRMKRA